MNIIKELKFAVPLCVAIACGASPAVAVPILGSNLTGFTVLGAETVTNVPTSTIYGSVGVSPGTALPGFNWVSGTATEDSQVTGGEVHSNTAVAAAAQAELTTARLNLDSLLGGTLLAGDLTLAGPLAPGVYTVPYAISNLTGSLTLDGGGDANAAWVFQMESSLITSPGSSVNVIGTGSGAGVFWNVRSSATLDTDTVFMGNILALTSIWMQDRASIECGRALADNGEVTLIQNSLSGVCSGVLSGSGGLSGGLDVTDEGNVVFLPFVDVVDSGTVPEPATLALLGIGLFGLTSQLRRRKSA
ncbi:MAG: DUF3494 domain-containing protein [Thiobacillus sp.]